MAGRQASRANTRSSSESHTVRVALDEDLTTADPSPYDLRAALKRDQQHQRCKQA
jgi:hypothetical protein